MRFSQFVLGAVLMAPLSNARAQTVQIDVNPTATLSGKFSKASSIGWYFTPTSTFFLNAIRTRFNPNQGTNVDRSVSIEVWSKTPATGGSLLRSTSFQSNTALGQFGGGGFAQILLQSGIQYFIGFRNIQGLGRNTTRDLGAWSLGPSYYSLGPVFTNDQYEIQTPDRGIENDHPSLELIGTDVSTVPEPMTMTLMATGLAVMGGATVLRRRKQAA